jgi:[ribosomal protein S5]-alanine N-acetyltransferase
MIKIVQLPAILARENFRNQEAWSPLLDRATLRTSLTRQVSSPMINDNLVDTNPGPSQGIRPMSLLRKDSIHLSEIRDTDKAVLVEHLQEPEIHTYTLTLPFPYTEANAEEFLARINKTKQEQGQPTSWAIRDEAEYLIGAIGFHDFSPVQSHRAEFGYWLAKPYWGQGIMTSMIQKACAIGFAKLNLSKITAYVFVNNLASARVLEKAGFEKEGYLKKHFRKNGQLLDSWAYALLR